MTADTSQVKKRKGGAPKGNQNALGNSGRPKTLHPEEEAKAIIEWVEKPDSLILLKFNTSRGYSRERLSEWANPNNPLYNVEFANAYRIAKETIAARREEFLHAGAIHEKAWSRYQAMYDKGLHEFERGDKTFEIEARMQLEAKSKVTTTPEEAQTHDAVINQIKALQASLDRSIADKSKSTESKS